MVVSPNAYSRPITMVVTPMASRTVPMSPSSSVNLQPNQLQSPTVRTVSAAGVAFAPYSTQQGVVAMSSPMPSPMASPATAVGTPVAIPRNVLLQARTISQRVESGPPGLSPLAPTPMSKAKCFGFKYPQPGWVSTVSRSVVAGAVVSNGAAARVSGGRAPRVIASVVDVTSGTSPGP